MKRRLLLASMLTVAVAAAAKPMKAKGSRGGSPPPPPANAIVPDAPLRDTLTGGSGQFTITWPAVANLVSGAAISVDPVSLYTVRWGTTQASVQEGGTPTGNTTTAGLTVTRTGLAAGTWYVSISATNGAGESSYSFSYSVTVT